MPLVEKMALWAGKNDTGQHERVDDEDLFEGVGEDDDDGDLDLPTVSAYRRAVIDSPSYRWLVSSLQREMSLGVDHSAGTASGRGIKEFLFHKLPIGAVSKSRGPLTHEVAFEFRWDPFVSLHRVSPYAVSSTITLVHDAESRYFATTFQEYLHRMWPETGVYLGGLVYKLVCYARGVRVNGTHRRKTGTFLVCY